MPVGPWITKYSARKAVVADPESQEQVIDEFTITAKSTPPQREQEQEQVEQVEQPEQPMISFRTFVALLTEQSEQSEQPEQPEQPVQPRQQQPRRKRRKRTPLGRAGTEFDGQYGDYIEFCDGTRAFVTS
jgi:hypothetical protein